MAIKKIKISKLPLASSLVGLFTVGVDKDNKSVKVGLEFVGDAAKRAEDAATDADRAAMDAQGATLAANTATQAANEAVSVAVTATVAADVATEAAEKAAAEACEATSAANTATRGANEAASNTNEAISNAEQATESANAAADRVDAAIAEATGAAEAATVATLATAEVAGRAELAAENAELATEVAGQKIEEATQAITDVRLVEEEMNRKVADVENRLVKDCGVYPNPAELRVAHPTGAAGYSALVQSTDTVWVWSTAKNDWMDSDKKGEVTDAQFQAHVSDSSKHLQDGERVKWNSKADNTPEFTQAGSRVNITSRESMPTILGKVARWLGDLKKVAFSNSYADLDNKPTSLPADGGNADTVDGKHAGDFATSAQGVKADSALQNAQVMYADDLNNLITAYQGGYATTCLNKPTAKDGYLHVIKYDSRNFTMQVAYETGTGNVFIRDNQNSPTSWQPWRKLSDGGNAATLDGKGARDFAQTNGVVNIGETSPDNIPWDLPEFTKVHIANVEYSTVITKEDFSGKRNQIRMVYGVLYCRYEAGGNSWKRVSPPDGGTTGQVLTKNSNTTGDFGWQTPMGGGEAAIGTPSAYNRGGDLYAVTNSGKFIEENQIGGMFHLSNHGLISEWLNGDMIPDATVRLINIPSLDHTSLDNTDDVYQLLWNSTRVRVRVNKKMGWSNITNSPALNDIQFANRMFSHEIKTLGNISKVNPSTRVNDIILFTGDFPISTAPSTLGVGVYVGLQGGGPTWTAANGDQLFYTRSSILICFSATRKVFLTTHGGVYHTTNNSTWHLVAREYIRA